MEKLTLNLHNEQLKKQIKKYAQKRGLTLSGLVENYLQNLVKVETRINKKDDGLPPELDSLLDGIEINKQLRIKDYKSLRDEMYASRTK